MESTRIGPFGLEEKLSGASSVYRAVHVEKQRMFALRLFHIPLGANESMVAEFAREWEVLKSLKHPNIVRCYGGGVEPQCGYLVYELVRGETLGGLLKMRRQFPWEMVVELALQMAAGLQCAHEKGVIHEQLSPKKLLLDLHGQLQICDLRFQRSQQVTFCSSTKRTPARAAYLAPEQCELTAVATPKADLYALGCMMYEMLTGSPPFSGATVEEVFAAKQTATPPRVGSVVYDCPVWLDVLVAQLLASDPAKRPHGAAAVQLALKEIQRRVAAGTGVVEHAAGGLSALRVAVTKTDARKLLGRDKPRDDESPPFYERAWFLALCLAGVLAIAAGGVWWSLRPQSPDKMIEQADALMATGDKIQWQQAREKFLDPLVKNHATTPIAARAQAHLDTIEMEQAETRLRISARLGRQPSSEGERLYAEALNFEKFGDRITALDKYQSLVQLLNDQGADRPYFQLARRQIARIQDDKQSKDRREFLAERLAWADGRAANGDTVEAHKIWQSIVTLYARNRELAPFVQQAQDRLSGHKPSEAAGGSEKSDEGELPPAAK